MPVQAAWNSVAPIRFDAAKIADRIEVPLASWPGNCYAVATSMVRCKVVKGRAVYGNYLGAIHPASMFHGKPVVRHGWVVQKDGLIVDPTRWVFESADPYVYVGLPTLEYDEGANLLRAQYARPAPIYDPNKQMATVPEGPARELFAALLGMSEVRAKVNTEQVFYLANMALQHLGEDAKLVYQTVLQMELQVFVPVDNYRKVMGQDW